MDIAFRTDASIQIGTGHVMRCLTLATELQRLGHSCQFICRDHKGNLAELIASKGFAVQLLRSSYHKRGCSKLNWNSHASWLGVHWQLDAEQTQEVLARQPVDWLVIDHYALDAQWEQQLSALTSRIMVIDDLADRAHQCELLLDQTYGRSIEDYQKRVPEDCQLLCGAEYALLRPEFAQWRDYSLQRRQQPELKQLLINMGGVDKDNVTGQVLKALHECEIPSDCKIIVVMGATAPWLDRVKQQAETLPWQADVKVDVDNMAQLMAESDLAIGAAGATAWERCCLGLPSIMIVLAENQKMIALRIEHTGAATTIASSKDVKKLLQGLISKNRSLSIMSEQAAKISDGHGVNRIISYLVKRSK